MQNGRPTADEALQKIKEYRHQLDAALRGEGMGHELNEYAHELAQDVI